MQLTKERITQAALALIDQKGLKKLSMRALGRELKVDAKAVYYYFPNKDALIAGVIAHAFSSLGLPEALEGTWREQLERIASAYRALLAQHPALVETMTQLETPAPALLDVIERVTVALKPIGLPGKFTVHVVEMLLEFAPSQAVAPEELESLHAGLLAATAGSYPASHELLTTMAPEDLDEDVDLMIEIVLEGIAAIVERYQV